MRHHAGSVEDGVNATVRVNRGIDERLDLCGAGDIGDDR